MKTLHTFFLFSLFATTTALWGQQKSDSCVDVVYLKNGSVFRGKITELKTGEDLVMTTWNGISLTLPEINVKRIVQRCPDKKRQMRPYSFREKGLYNATRIGLLIGKDYFGENTTGFSICHSTGWMFGRMLGAGVGAGIETYVPDGAEATTYPIFAEVRGYFQAKNITPFYVLSGGWAFTGSNADSRDGFIDNWSGGWHAKARIGYRIENNVTIYGGLSLQKKTRDWNVIWGGERGRDTMLHKRFELGLGVLL